MHWRPCFLRFTDHQKDWNDDLQTVLLAYRTAIHESTGYTPFLVMFGRSPSLSVEEDNATVRVEYTEVP